MPRRSFSLPRRALRGVDRRRRRLAGMARRIRHDLAARRPEAPDPVLAARVRSMLGPLEKRLDVPRVKVMVERGRVLLHGAVATPDDEVALIRAAMDVPGIRAVDSRLHVGLGAGDGRPSAGRARAVPSAARRRLVEAAGRAAGVEEDAPVIAGAVLAAVAERIPPREREHLCAHLPEDVRELTHRPRSPGTVRRRMRTISDLVDVVAELAGMDGAEPLDRARLVVATRAVIEELRDLVPEEVADVAAVLPRQLRDLWLGVSA